MHLNKKYNHIFSSHVMERFLTNSNLYRSINLTSSLRRFACPSHDPPKCSVNLLSSLSPIFCWREWSVWDSFVSFLSSLEPLPFFTSLSCDFLRCNIKWTRHKRSTSWKTKVKYISISTISQGKILKNSTYLQIWLFWSHFFDFNFIFKPFNFCFC